MKPTKITFARPGDFQALADAYQWCRDNDFSHGPLCRTDTVALMRGNAEVEKWRNLSVIERMKIDGQITSPDFRNGPVTVEIF